MGVRIEAHAIDLPQFEALLECRIGELLWRHFQESTSDSPPFWLQERDEDAVYSSRPGKHLFAPRTSPSGERGFIELDSEAAALEIPFLRQTARDYLDGHSIYALNWFLRGCAEIPGIDCVRVVSDGNRRWWIGGVLQHAREVMPFSDADYAELVRLVRKVLRGGNCGYEIPAGDPGVEMPEILLSIEDNSDDRLGYWNSADARSASRLFRMLLTSTSRFQINGEDWDDWVRANLKSYADAVDFGYSNLVIVTMFG